MVFVHIDKKNCMNGTCNMIKELDTSIGKKNTKTFLLIFMEGCGPCNATRPEWTKIKNVLDPHFLKRKDIVVAAIDHQLAEKLVNLKTKPTGFPTMRFITDGGNISENYEDSNIVKKDRTIDSFIEWIHLKTGENSSQHYKINKRYTNKRHTNKRHTNKRHKTQKGGKWSLKYKKSINCNRPKGFSQKQHCKYGRK
jgi:thiol-disulfide isomerase/thioredoxin